MGKVACISIRKTTGEFSRRVVVSFSPFSSPNSYYVAERKGERRLSDAAEERTKQQHTREEQQKVIVVKRKEKEQEKGEKRVKPASLLECLAKRSEISECSQHQRAYARQIGPKSSFHLAPDKNALLNIRASYKKERKESQSEPFRHRAATTVELVVERKKGGRKEKAKKKLESQEMKCCASFQSHSFVLRWNSYKFEAL